ncbi:DUF1684 domain-containing protein [Halonotius terrestris]|uniref:DUF1684 domain-containing protein n=1 Tax=Halonotius terrestris TaxID=2487750 RepID=A0A8J8PBF4_9EURY|nr:DUF1684 domain-containing protein [Halonotius terrestris]TQQ80988.1 DUF1684 domain-containing protein [Halonotius terrestris]
MADSEDADAEAEYERWVSEIKQMRADKDEFFTEHPQSPIQPEVRDDFEGLSYFEPKPEFRVPTRVRVYSNPDPIELDVTAGQPIRYLRPFIFEFELRDERQQLAGYQQEGEDTDTIFIPFRDKTTGQQTYHRGRYMETEPDEELTNGDTVTLDFNLAYNPFCAYSETFACPLPPEENWLDVVVPAGERKPPEAIVVDDE